LFPWHVFFPDIHLKPRLFRFLFRKGNQDLYRDIVRTRWRNGVDQ